MRYLNMQDFIALCDTIDYTKHYESSGFYPVIEGKEFFYTQERRVNIKDDPCVLTIKAKFYKVRGTLMVELDYTIKRNDGQKVMMHLVVHHDFKVSIIKHLKSIRQALEVLGVKY